MKVTANENDVGKQEAKITLVTGGNNGIALAPATLFVNAAADAF
jgi:hypothetical protein